MVSSDEEGEILPHHVTNYYFEDNNDRLVCFSVLPIQWDDEIAINEAKLDENVFLRGKFDGGLQKIHKKVIAWKFDLSYMQPTICVLDKDNHWIELQKPLKKLENVYRKVLVVIHWMHFVKANPSATSDSAWNHLSKTFCAYEVGPSEKDLLDFLPLINETARRDKDLEASVHFRTFSMKSSLGIAFKEDVPIIKKFNFIANNDEVDAGDDPQDDDETADDIFDTVCAICDEGGEMLCCTGMCLRSFHPTIADGVGSQCKTLGFHTVDEVDAIDNFLCQNCLYKQHQCFVCGELGSSARSSSQEVFRCCSAFCGRFYHPDCVSKLLHFGNETQVQELEQKISGGEPFTCPSHKCFICKQAEDKDKCELQFALCRRCPRVFHRKCLPKNIIFAPDAINPQRAWEGLLPNKRILIYCMRHKINRLLKTPVRDHLIFPNDKDENKKRAEPQSSRGKMLASTKRSVISEGLPVEKPGVKKLKTVAKPINFVGMGDFGIQTDKIFQKKCYELPKKSNTFDIGRKSLERSSCPSFNRFSKSENKLLPVGESISYSCKPKQQNVAAGKTKNTSPDKSPTRVANVARPQPINDNVAQRIKALVEKVHSSFDIEEFRKRRCVPPKSGRSKDALKSITLGLVKGSVKAVRTALLMLESKCSLEDIKTVCEPEILRKIFRWRRMLKIYLAPFLHGNRYTSFGRHFTQTEKLKEIVFLLHHYVLDGDMVVDFCCGSNDFSCLMKEKLEKTGKSCSFKNYDLLPAKNDFCFEKRDWMTVGLDELPDGSQLIMGLNPPFGVNACLANAFIEKALQFRPKLLVLIVPKETIRVDKKAAYHLIWEDEVLLKGNAFYLPGSVDVNNEKLNDWNINPPTLSLWSRADWAHSNMIIARENDHVLEAQYDISNLTGVNGYNNFYGDMHVGGGMSNGLTRGGMSIEFDAHGWLNTGNLHVGGDVSNRLDSPGCQSIGYMNVRGGMPSGFDGLGWQRTSNLPVGDVMSSGFDGCGWQTTGHLPDGMSSRFDCLGWESASHLHAGGGMSSLFDGQVWKNTGNMNLGCDMSSGFDGHGWQNTSNFSNHVGHEDWIREYMKPLSGELNESLPTDDLHRAS